MKTGENKADRAKEKTDSFQKQLCFFLAVHKVVIKANTSIAENETVFFFDYCNLL